MKRQILNLLRFYGAVNLTVAEYFVSNNEVVLTVNNSVAFDQSDLKPVVLGDSSNGYYIPFELPNNKTITSAATVLYEDGEREDVSVGYDSHAKAITGFIKNNLQTILIKLS